MNPLLFLTSLLGPQFPQKVSSKKHLKVSASLTQPPHEPKQLEHNKHYSTLSGMVLSYNVYYAKLPHATCANEWPDGHDALFNSPLRFQNLRTRKSVLSVSKAPFRSSLRQVGLKVIRLRVQILADFSPFANCPNLLQAACGCVFAALRLHLDMADPQKVAHVASRTYWPTRICGSYRFAHMV